MCKIPAGSGLGGRKSRVTIGANVLPGRNSWRRCITGPLEKSSTLIKTLSSPQTKLEDLHKIPRTQPHPDLPHFEVLYQIIQAWLRLLLYHSSGLDGADGGLRVALGWLGERVDMVEYIC